MNQAIDEGKGDPETSTGLGLCSMPRNPMVGTFVPFSRARNRRLSPPQSTRMAEQACPQSAVRYATRASNHLVRRASLLPSAATRIPPSGETGTYGRADVSEASDRERSCLCSFVPSHQAPSPACSPRSRGEFAGPELFGLFLLNALSPAGLLRSQEMPGHARTRRKAPLVTLLPERQSRPGASRWHPQ